MDREKARVELLSIADASLRQAEANRIEGQYHLETAAANLFMSRKGRFPQREELVRVLDAMNILIYDSSKTSEEAARIKYANGVLDSEFR